MMAVATLRSNRAHTAEEAEGSEQESAPLP